MHIITISYTKNSILRLKSTEITIGVSTHAPPPETPLSVAPPRRMYRNYLFPAAFLCFPGRRPGSSSTLPLRTRKPSVRSAGLRWRSSGWPSSRFSCSQITNWLEDIMATVLEHRRTSENRPTSTYLGNYTQRFHGGRRRPCRRMYLCDFREHANTLVERSVYWSTG